MTNESLHNGIINGNGDVEENETFLFTSESVGEGHPGNFVCHLILFTVVDTSLDAL